MKKYGFRIAQMKKPGYISLEVRPLLHFPKTYCKYNNYIEIELYYKEKTGWGRRREEFSDRDQH